MCFFDHLPIFAKFDQDICVMSKKHWLWSISNVLSNLQFQKLTTWAKMGKTLGFVKKIHHLNSTEVGSFWVFFRILLEFCLDFAWVLSFFTTSKKSPGIGHKYPNIAKKESRSNIYSIYILHELWTQLVQKLLLFSIDPSPWYKAVNGPLLYSVPGSSKHHCSCIGTTRCRWTPEIEHPILLNLLHNIVPDCTSFHIILRGNFFSLIVFWEICRMLWYPSFVSICHPSVLVFRTFLSPKRIRRENWEREQSKCQKNLLWVSKGFLISRTFRPCPCRGGRRSRLCAPPLGTPWLLVGWPPPGAWCKCRHLTSGDRSSSWCFGSRNRPPIEHKWTEK